MLKHPATAAAAANTCISADSGDVVVDRRRPRAPDVVELDGWPDVVLVVEEEVELDGEEELLLLELELVLLLPVVEFVTFKFPARRSAFLCYIHHNNNNNIINK